MRIRFYLGLLLPLLVSQTFAAPAIPQRRDLVGAYYYGWYFPPKWKDLAAQLTPVLGQYNTDSIPIVTKHIDTAAYYGVDVFFMSWWKKTDVTDSHLRNGFLKSPSVNKIKFAMVVEPLGELDTLDGKRDGVVDFNSPEVNKAWIEMFQYFKDNFWNHPSYLKIDGRPVVLVYVTRTFKNFGSQHIDSLKAHVGNVYLMADEAFIGAQSDPATARNGIRNRFSVFESYVSYNSYEAALIQADDSALAYQNRVGLPYYKNWAAKTVFHPPIMPYYQDFRPGHPPLPGSMPQFKQVIKDIRALPQWAPAGDSVNRIYMVTSWNEWFEGTSIEPSVEKGIGPCQVLREAFVEQGTRSRPEPVKAAGETAVKLKSVVKGAYVCVEKNAVGNAAARPGCEAASFVMVDLGNNEVALRDPASGKYLGVNTDGLLYPLESQVGTWEIFRVTKQGAQIALQSKKTGAYVKPAVDAGGGLSVRGALDADAWFAVEPGTIQTHARGTGTVTDMLPYAISFRGPELILIPGRGARLSAYLSGLDGRVLASRSCVGACSFGSQSASGMRILTVNSGGVVRRHRIAALAR